jgi:hypothetical protein
MAAPQRRFQPQRLAWFLTGLFWLAWLGYEDRGLTAVVLLAGCIGAALGVSAWRRWRAGYAASRSAWIRSAILGALAGASVAPLAALLILVKTSLHAHPVPDFSAEDLGRVLSVWPAWTGAGMLVGLAGAGLAAERARRVGTSSIVSATGVAYNHRRGGHGGMAESPVVQVYLCPRCLDSQASAGVCPRCGLERLGCRPGDPDDPCRRPLVDAAGQVRTRAPLWWLRQTVEPLTRHLDSGTERRA